MLITRRVLVLLLLGSFLATLALAAAALVHETPQGAAVGEPSAPSEPSALEAGLWVGFAIVLAIFAITFLAFRREVQFEKARAQSKRDRSAFLRQVREYEMERRGVSRENN